MKNYIQGYIATLLFLSTMVLAEENTSNPLAAVNNTDIRAKYFDLDKGDRKNYYIDGATMLNPKLKYDRSQTDRTAGISILQGHPFN